MFTGTLELGETRVYVSSTVPVGHVRRVQPSTGAAPTWVRRQSADAREVSLLEQQASSSRRMAPRLCRPRSQRKVTGSGAMLTQPGRADGEE